MKPQARGRLLRLVSRLANLLAGERFGRTPWLFPSRAGPLERLAQALHQRVLALDTDCRFGPGTYVSPAATVGAGSLRLGERSVVGSEAQLGVEVEIGADCTVNAGAVVRGKVRLGDDVRVASGAQILGFNHRFDDLLRPIHRQALTRKGIEIGDDVWVGANAVVLDGVAIGAHAVVGAGAVVTRDVPAWALVAGNPARVLRSRLTEDAARDAYRGFVERLPEQLSTVLRHHSLEDGFKAAPGLGGKARAWTDAIELAAMVDRPLPGHDRKTLIDRLQGFQDPDSGLFQGPYGEGHLHKGGRFRDRMECAHAAYLTMAAGYALECLGCAPRHPVTVAEAMPEAVLRDQLQGLAWTSQAWNAGAWVDHFATACYFNARYHAGGANILPLFHWLLEHNDPASGLWGAPHEPGDWSQPVNGFYRLARGTFAQFGQPLPHPERIVDSVLAHARNPKYFSPNATTACHVLDVIHPLWLCRRQTAHREREVREFALFWLMHTLRRWDRERGLAFETAKGAETSLKGTEMWLVILWYCADLLGLNPAGAVFRPRGIHRPEPGSGLDALTGPTVEVACA